MAAVQYLDKDRRIINLLCGSEDMIEIGSGQEFFLDARLKIKVLPLQ